MEAIRRGGRQLIPRPDHARPGGPPVWASYAEAQRRGITLARVRAALLRPGSSARPHAYRAPHVELPGLDQPGTRPAAVLCALFEEDGESHVVLTRRSSNLRSHTGEVSFPGGRLEDGEAAVTAALREAGEEIGVDPAGVEILGQLSPLSTFSSRATITPFVGALPARPTLSANPAEVERAFDVSLAELLADGVYHQEVWQLPGAGWREMNFFELVGDTVWGATARMLVELLALIVETR